MKWSNKKKKIVIFKSLIFINSIQDSSQKGRQHKKCYQKVNFGSFRVSRDKFQFVLG